MSFDYEFVTKIERRLNGETWFHRGNDHFHHQGKDLLIIKDEWKIENPSFLQKFKYCVINESQPILLDNDEVNEFIYIDNAGRMAFSQDVKVLCWF